MKNCSSSAKKMVLPTDLIPDFMPGGYLDDTSALIMALKTIWSNLTPNTKAKAQTRLSSWFGNVATSDLNLF